MIRDDSETGEMTDAHRVARRAEGRPRGGAGVAAASDRVERRASPGPRAAECGRGPRGEARREKKLRTAGSVLSHARGGAFPWTA